MRIHMTLQVKHGEYETKPAETVWRPTDNRPGKKPLITDYSMWVMFSLFRTCFLRRVSSSRKDLSTTTQIPGFNHDSAFSACKNLNSRSTCWLSVELSA